MVVADVAQQLSQLGGLGDCRKVPAARRRQAARVLVDEVLAGFQRAHVHGVLVDVLDSLADALRRFKVASILGAVQALHDFRWKDRFDRLVAYPGKDVNFQVPDDFLGVVFRPLLVLLGAGVPGPRQQLEGLQARDVRLFLLPVAYFFGIKTIGTLAVGFVGLGACWASVTSE
ncbi:MAG: hypothetical protein WBG56_11945 [Castellaniella sp.]